MSRNSLHPSCLGLGLAPGGSDGAHLQRGPSSGAGACLCRRPRTRVSLRALACLQMFSRLFSPQRGPLLALIMERYARRQASTWLHLIAELVAKEAFGADEPRGAGPEQVVTWLYQRGCLGAAHAQLGIAASIRQGSSEEVLAS